MLQQRDKLKIKDVTKNCQKGSRKSSFCTQTYYTYTLVATYDTIYSHHASVMRTAQCQSEPNTAGVKRFGSLLNGIDPKIP